MPPIGVTLPYKISSGSVGYFQTTEDELTAVENDIRSILVTNWGERPMHADFGCNFRELLFEPLVGEELRVRVADRVLQQMDRWLPFVDVDELNIVLSEDDNAVPENGFFVRMRFSLDSLPDLQGGATFIVIP